VVVFIEDLARTWFIVRQTRDRTSVVNASLVFSGIISAFEIITQVHGYIYAAAQNIFGLSGGMTDPRYEEFFSNHSELFFAIILDITRPIDHFCLCICLFHFWRMRIIIGFFLTISSHIGLNVMMYLIYWENQESVYFNTAIFSALFTLSWGVVTYIILRKEKHYRNYGDSALN
jgi:hypothetical protein